MPIAFELGLVLGGNVLITQRIHLMDKKVFVYTIPLCPAKIILSCTYLKMQFSYAKIYLRVAHH